MSTPETDKYFKPLRDDDKHLNPLYDMKEVPKRANQLGLAALCIGISLAGYDAIIGLYVSSFLLGCFCFAIMMFMYLKYNGDIRNLTIAIISLVCGMLVSSALLQGLQSEQYLFFFPILIAVPVIINLKQTRHRQSAIYMSIILFSFLATIFIGRYVPHQESFTVSQITRLAYVNRIIAICSTIVFAVAYIFFEEKYIHELTLQSQQVIDSRTRFLATMGHELRTPLNGIIGVINLLKKAHSPAQNEEYLRVLKYCSDHMLLQVNNILDFNKIEAGKLELHPALINLKQLIVNSSIPFNVLFREKGVELKLEIGEGLDIFVMADDVRLVQVFNNLLSNALKFTDTGYVKIKADITAIDGNITTVVFMVEDTGIGIDKADQKLIFEGFGQVYDEDNKRFNGAGLGLTITLRLLKLMDSGLQLNSVKGGGSTFSFQLQLARGAEPAPKKSARVLENLGGIKILLAEDDPINMMVAHKILSGFRAKVTGVYNGRDALKVLKKDANFGAILLDLEMPVMNGYATVLEIKKDFPHIPVIAFTASLVDEKMLADLHSIGFTDCILKPFLPNQLAAIIKKHAVSPMVEA